MTSAFPTASRFAAIALLALTLPACGGNMDDLDQYINDVKARPGGA